MEWDPNERDAWVADAQRWIGQIKGVLQCKIDLDSAGEVEGVHVVADMDRSPRHIVRDVEGLLKARLGIDVYYKKIGIVQVLDNGQPEIKGQTSAPEKAATAGEPTPVPNTGPSIDPTGEPASGTAQNTAQNISETKGEKNADLADNRPTPAVLLAEEIAPRVVCSGVGIMASEMLVRSEVQLRAGELESSGRCEGPNHAQSDLILTAKATLESISQLVSDPVLLHLSEIRVEELGGQPVTIVAIDLVEGRRSETLFGTCSSKHNSQQSVVYAVLDALNRRLSLYSLKSAEASA